MIRDIELMRKILFTIEKEFKPGQGYISKLTIDGYDMQVTGEHCQLLVDAGLIRNYKPSYADDRLLFFSVGNLTNQGYDFLELVRNNKVWEQTKTDIETKQRPKTIEEIARIAGIIAGNFFKELNT